LAVSPEAELCRGTMGCCQQAGHCGQVLPSKVCCCFPLHIGLQALVGCLTALRLAGVICSGFYADFLLVYSLFWKAIDGKPVCDFTNQKVWVIIWQIMNLLGVLGVGVALGWYLTFGFWAMLHEPVHFVVFLILAAILPLMLYTAFIILALYNYLKEAYIDELLGRAAEEDGDPGLTHGGRRISV